MAENFSKAYETKTRKPSYCTLETKINNINKYIIENNFLGFFQKIYKVNIASIKISISQKQMIIEFFYTRHLCTQKCVPKLFYC